MITLELTKDELAVLEPVFEDYMNHTHKKIMKGNYFSDPTHRNIYKNISEGLLEKLRAKSKDVFE